MNNIEDENKIAIAEALPIIEKHAEIAIEAVDCEAESTGVPDQNYHSTSGESSISHISKADNTSEILEIYTDGACSGNPGPGGWSAVILHDGKQEEVVGGEKQTTNNKMELLAAINGLKSITHRDITVKMFTDSLYVKNGITNWINNWKLKDYKDVKNVELWKELDSLCQKFKIEWNWVKAHNGNKYNEIADKLAREQAQRARYT